MIVNNSCVLGNGTSTCLAPGSSAGLAVGLTLFFLLLVIVAGVIVYMYRRNKLPFGRRESQMKEDCTERPQTDSHTYTSMMREQSVGQNPIYENLTTRKTGYNRPEVNQRRSPGEPEEDLYLQCETDDAIYSNDPACNLALHQDSQEDVYIVPDS